LRSPFVRSFFFLFLIGWLVCGFFRKPVPEPKGGRLAFPGPWTFRRPPTIFVANSCELDAGFLLTSKPIRIKPGSGRFKGRVSLVLTTPTTAPPNVVRHTCPCFEALVSHLSPKSATGGCAKTRLEVLLCFLLSLDEVAKGPTRVRRSFVLLANDAVAVILRLTLFGVFLHGRFSRSFSSVNRRSRSLADTLR